MHSVLTSPLAKGVYGALIGGVCLLIGKHLWDDHWALHTLAAYLNQHAAAINSLK